MQQVIMVVHLMTVVALVALILYQKSEGGALGIGGGGGLFTGRGQANALTRATGILAAIFFLTSLALTALPAWERNTSGGAFEEKIELKEIPAPPTAPLAPGAGKETIFDQLQRAQEQQGAPALQAPAASGNGAEEPAKAQEPKAPAAGKPRQKPAR